MPDSPSDGEQIKPLSQVARFKELAPSVLDARLNELGYFAGNTEDFHHSNTLWSTKLFYNNRKLRLSLEIEEAPYYSDYGFTIFLNYKDNTKKTVLCNVPSEQQDANFEFLINVCDKFFKNSAVVSLLAGKSLEPFAYIRLEK